MPPTPHQAEFCDIDSTLVLKKGTMAPTHARLVGVDRPYFRAECIGAASAVLVDGQAEIGIVDD